MFPPNKIQESSSYKKFQEYISKYSKKQITLVKRGSEPEKSGKSAQFMNYTDNDFNMVSSVIFELLPFSFQKGVFQEYFKSKEINLDLNLSDIELKTYVEDYFK